jgi:hypothetical protein
MTRPSVMVAYAVLAHRNVEQVFRLLEHLQDGLRILCWDAKAKAQAAVWREAQRRGIEHVTSRRVHWGHWSIVEAALDAVRIAALAKVERLVFLSGQCYPLTSAEKRHDSLRLLGDQSTFRTFLLPIERWGPEGGFDRTDWIHVAKPPLLPMRSKMLRLPIRRRFPNGVSRYGGSQWGTLSAEAIEYCAGLPASDLVLRAYRYALIPDEQFFQTVLMNSSLQGKVLSRSTHYADWTVSSGPRLLRSSDYPALVSCNDLFARKFDMEIDGAIMDRIDRELIRQEATPAPSTRR